MGWGSVSPRILASHSLSLAPELALRLFTEAPCYWGFEAEGPISGLITELIRQLGDSCCGGLWGTGTAPNMSPALKNTSGPPDRREEQWPDTENVRSRRLHGCLGRRD